MQTTSIPPLFHLFWPTVLIVQTEYFLSKRTTLSVDPPCFLLSYLSGSHRFLLHQHAFYLWFILGKEMAQSTLSWISDQKAIRIFFQSTISNFQSSTDLLGHRHSGRSTRKLL